MPSDERLDSVLKLLSTSRETYRAALRLTIEQVRGFIAACGEEASGVVDRATAELGNFAAGRINATRFASMFIRSEAPSPESLYVVATALGVLQSLESSGDALFIVDVAPGVDLRAAVDAALSNAGRAFGAARVVELVRTRRYRADQHESLLQRLPFRAWNRAERRLAPPLVVRVNGSDFYAATLADYLDGAMKIAIVVDGPAAPAPLVRLITPATFVMQTTSVDEIARVAETGAPAIAALVAEGCAHFVHDPAAGRDAWQRLVVKSRPKVEPRHAIGGISVAQQADELRLLDALAKAPPTPSSGEGKDPLAPAGRDADAPVDPVDRLAAWLLQQVQPEAAVTES